METSSKTTMPEEKSNSEFLVEQKNALKLIFNSRGYGWEIKVIDEEWDKMIDKVIEIDSKCQKRWGKREVTNDRG